MENLRGINGRTNNSGQMLSYRQFILMRNGYSNRLVENSYRIENVIQNQRGRNLIFIPQSQLFSSNSP